MTAEAAGRSALILLLHVLTFFGGCTATTVAVMRMGERAMTLPAEERVASTFPVVVVTGSSSGQPRAQVIFKRNLERFLQKHPDYTFLFPENGIAEIVKQIRAASRESASRNEDDPDVPVLYDVNIRVKRIAGNRMQFEVSATWDDDWDNVGWYEATEKEIFLQKGRTYRGVGIAVQGGLLGVLCGAILQIPVRWAMKKALARPESRRTGETQR